MAPNTTLSARDAEIVAAVLQCLKTPPKIDYERLAEKAGYKNASSARACFQDIKKKLRISAGGDTGKFATPAATKKVPNPRKRKQLSSPPDSSSATLASSSPTGNSNDETTTRQTKKPKVTKARSITASRAKKPKISTPETEEDINNAKAIAAGRARYAADKLAAEIGKEDGEEEEHPVADDAEGEDEWPVGMNVDSGEDEGLTAYELVKNEVFGEGVEV
ncbi:hypothetical protein M436DRAFT_52788 [Aureobasidium namibiae CBS 147.97]|uniref:Histone H1 n=1 Tax=Aureobasidium namibiae CBS 147.97 TaxID=1043004 RepID=A0A074WLI4_9PEZI